MTTVKKRADQVRAGDRVKMGDRFVSVAHVQRIGKTYTFALVDYPRTMRTPAIAAGMMVEVEQP